MKRLARWGAIFALASYAWGQEIPKAPNIAPAKCGTPKVDEQLRRIPEEWMKSYNKGDAVAVANLYTKNAYYLTQHFVTGVLQGRTAIQMYVQRGVDAHYHIDTIEVLATGCDGNMAYVLDRYTATNTGDQVMGVNLVVLRRIQDRWRIVAHEAAVPDPVSAIRELKNRHSR
jgi:uncharacterized protein (TIGR02246 family)